MIIKGLRRSVKFLKHSNFISGLFSTYFNIVLKDSENQPLMDADNNYMYSIDKER